MPVIKNSIHIGDLVEHTKDMSSFEERKKNGIITWRSPTLHTYEGSALGGFYDIAMRYGLNQSDEMYMACFLYRVYWPDGTETVELGDDLTLVT
jgi:hypothetical protein